MLAISYADASPAVDHARDLLREYFAWVLELASESADAPTFQGYEQELANLPGPYAPSRPNGAWAGGGRLSSLPAPYVPPGGRLFIATWNGQPAGCIALKAHDGSTGELKRLYVRPAFRGLQIGKSLVTALIEEARRCGYRRLKLDSHISMTNAHAIYRGAGFKDVDAPPDFPEPFRPIVVFMELELEPGS